MTQEESGEVMDNSLNEVESNDYYREQQRKTIESLDAIDKKIDSLLIQEQLLFLVNEAEIEE